MRLPIQRGISAPHASENRRSCEKFEIGKRMQAYGDDVESVREFAADIVASMCRRLVDAGVPELHFYTLNVSRPTQMVLTRLS